MPAGPRLAALALLCSACASAPEGGAVHFETESYLCGAEPGLGCGLRLAPALDALAAIEGVAKSGASWDGRYVRIELVAGADADRVAAAAAAVLEGDERRLARAPSDAWWDAGGTVELSRREAAVLAGRLGGLAAMEADLESEEREQLLATLHEELKAAFERAHAAGGGLDRLQADMPRARAAFEARLGFLTPEERASVAAFLDREL